MVIHNRESSLSRQFKSILLSIFSDCREFYPSRRLFDDDHHRLERTTLIELYTEWKAINLALCSGTFPISSSICLNWSLHPGSSAREVRAYRQLHGIFSRLEGHCSSDHALDSFASRVSNVRSRAPSGLDFRAKDLISAWLGPCPVLAELIPQHGPGAVAESLKTSLAKAEFKVIYRSLLPYGGSSLLHLNSRHEDMHPFSLEVRKHAITRVIAVPKDFLRPRIISCEPLTMQFLQQGIARYMMNRLEAFCPYINFRDQKVNQDLTYNLNCATIDLSDASDYVSRRIVRQIFPKDWCDLLFACRSSFVAIDGRVIPCRSFAPMGSALCFPVESLVFAAITVASILAAEGEQYVRANKRQIRIYGDDIIVPLDVSRAVLTGLSLCGFKVNEQKCCTNGFFRESCGMETYNGVDVTVVRPKTLKSTDSRMDRRIDQRVLPMVGHANALYNRGFSSAAQLFASFCKFPVALGDTEAYAHSALSWPWPGKTRWNRSLQRLEQQALLPVQVECASDTGDGYAMLFQHFTSCWSSERVSNPRIKPKTRWVLAAPLGSR